jgi:hypothetical protein
VLAVQRERGMPEQLSKEICAIAVFVLKPCVDAALAA